MNRFRKLLSLYLCVCMATFALPVSASSTPEADAFRVELTDAQLQESVGGAGQVDATLADYAVGGERAEALFVNRTAKNLSYSLSIINPNGAVLETIESGTLPSGAAKIVAGTPTLGGPGGANRIVQARLWSPSIGGLQAKDTSWTFASIDNDGDGMTNEVEVANGLDPNKNDADLDNDRDFLTNYEEVILRGTNPNVADAGLAPDTDGDGIVDKVELAFGTDPEKADSLGLDSDDVKYKLHVLNRLTFGPTSSVLAEIHEKTVPVWIEEQLTPIGLDEIPPDPAQVLRERYVITFSAAQAHFVGPMRPVHSLKQLQARMAWFWDNHFNTAIQVSRRSNEEFWEEDQFFLNAFGNFKDLVKISGQSFSMLRYLDLYRNSRNAVNENYAREVMELHTLGQTTSDPDAIYGVADISALASILTGWRWTLSADEVSRYGRWSLASSSIVYDNLNLFNFRPGVNDTGTKIFLGESFGGGQSEGERALDLLVEQPRTAHFICRKLARYFIADNPLPATVESCQEVFSNNLGASNQIGLVLANLFDSTEFQDANTQRTKFKDNQEYLFSLARFLGYRAEGTPDETLRLNRTTLGERTNEVGQRMYAKGTPDGWPEAGDAWTDTSSALSRFAQGNRMVLQVGDGAQDISLVDYFMGQGIIEARDIIAHLYMMLLGSHYNEEHVYLGYWTLGLDGTDFALTDSDAEDKLEQLVARIVQLPEFNLH